MKGPGLFRRTPPRVTACAAVAVLAGAAVVAASAATPGATGGKAAAAAPAPPARAAEGGVAAALARGDAASREQARVGIASAIAAEAAALQAGGGWNAEDVQRLAATLLVDPLRFVDDVGFRQRVLELLPAVLPPAVPPALRDEILGELNQVRGFDFAAAEAVEVGWGAVPRASRERATAAGSRVRVSEDPALPVEASVYSAPSWLVEPLAATRLVAAVRAVAPERTLVVLTDAPAAFAGLAASTGAHVLPTHGREYSPWPRDPLSFARTGDGAVALLLRPNRQPGREGDLTLGRELVQTLPPELGRRWGGVTLSYAPVPFHNGHLLPLGDDLWLTVHSVELRILELLGEPAVPTHTFGTRAGVARFVAAARQAATELGELYGREPRFVHPLPGDDDDPRAAAALLEMLGGGAGYDLDSLVTLLPRGGGAVALVADLSLGVELVRDAPAADWQAFAATYGAREPQRLAERLAGAAASDAGAALDRFADALAGHLAAEGLAVARLPLLLLERDLLPPTPGVQPLVLIGWNNMVVERRGGAVHAEGFATGLAAGDRAAESAYAAAGARLHLLPPLVGSVVRNGGYRCASNQLRGAAAAPAAGPPAPAAAAAPSPATRSIT